MGLLRGLSGKESAHQCRRHRDTGSVPESEDPLEEDTAACFSILAWEIPGTGNLAGYNPWGHKRVRHGLMMKQHTEPEVFPPGWLSWGTERHFQWCLKFWTWNDYLNRVTLHLRSKTNQYQNPHSSTLQSYKRGVISKEVNTHQHFTTFHWQSSCVPVQGACFSLPNSFLEAFHKNFNWRKRFSVYL